MSRYSFLLVVAFGILSCTDKSAEENVDTPTRGEIPLIVDENLRSITIQLVDIFETSYPKAFLLTEFKPEADVAEALYADTARLAMMTRNLRPDEVKYFEDKKFGLEQVKLGTEAVVLVLNKENPDTAFTLDRLRRMLLGQDSLWSQLTPGSELGKVEFVFDHPKSSNLRFITDSILDGQKPGTNCFALSSTDSVISYVSRSKGAVGVIGLCWIGDKDATADTSRLNRIKIAAIGRDTSAAWKPSQTSIATGNYPLKRDFWIVKIGKRPGLGTGFATFALSERGQLIVQRAGLVPAVPAERKIEMTTY